MEQLEFLLQSRAFRLAAEHEQNLLEVELQDVWALRAELPLLVCTHELVVEALEVVHELLAFPNKEAVVFLVWGEVLDRVEIFISPELSQRLQQQLQVR